MVSDSWGDTLGDLFTDAATKAAFDNTFIFAGATGVSVLFSSGDSGDNFADTGLAAPDYPPSSPFVTAVGGTTLEVNGATLGRPSTAGRPASSRCATSSTTSCGSTIGDGCRSPSRPGAAVERATLHPALLPGPRGARATLALRNEALFGPVPLRVEPDISMDADAQSGMLIGLTQTFPNGVYYDQFKEGGTSLASPLLAGVIADADQAAGVALGFLNPTLYKAYSEYPTAFNDILASGQPELGRSHPRRLRE